MKYDYLFGPVPSRRLGISLGIDLVPYKTCSLDCVYCECGRTNNLTISTKEYVPTRKVIKELDKYLTTRPNMDFLTFSGSGEPTLHSGIGTIINHLKKNYSEYKIAVLTNGTLFWDKDVLESVLEADVILPSLDAISNECFQKVNRPHKELEMNKILSGLEELRKRFSGEMWLEIFIVPGVNDNPEELSRFREEIRHIRPDKVQLNYLDRPCMEAWVEMPDNDSLKRGSDILGDVEIVGKPIEIKDANRQDEDLMHIILSTIRRRPCTVEDLSKILGKKISEVNKYIRILEKSGQISSKRSLRGIYFYIKK